jgi:stage V sporulation protein B
LQQQKSQAQNFMHGALLITLAQLITKVLGAIHRPLAQYFIGDAGLALATPPSSAYYIILAVSSVGLNVAISRLVSERLALQDLRGARRVYRIAVNMLVISGIVFSLLFGLMAKPMAAYFHMPEAWMGFAVLAPALFFVALLCVFRGLYQGMQQMKASAISQVVEQVGRVTLSLAIIALVTRFGVTYGAAAFNAGNTIGIFLAVLYFFWVFFKEKPTAHWDTVAPGVVSYEHESASRLLGKILSIAAPLAVMGAVLPVMTLVDSKIVTGRLIALGVADTLAKEPQAWLANATTLRDLPAVLTTALYISLVPAIAESYATGSLEQARYRISTAFRMTFLIGLPATVGLFAGAKDIYGILYTGPGWVVMAPLAISTIFVMMQQTASGALQGMGKIWLSVSNMLLGVGVKILLTYWWVAIPALKERGAAYATVAGFAVAAGLQLIALWRHLRFAVDVKGQAVKPLVAAALMAVAIWVTSPLVHRFIHAQRIAGALVVALGGLVYAVAVLALGGVTMADIGLIPGFPQRAADLLRKYRLLRD